MTIQHHPTDELLLAYAAGTLDQGQHIAVATHLLPCAACRSWVQSLEGLGGSVLSALPASAMASDALSRVEARLDEAARAGPSGQPHPDLHPDVPGLPAFVRSRPAGNWKWVGPHLRLRRLTLSEPGDTRVFLLKSSPRTRFLAHGHTGFEMTTVLTGSFSHDGKRYGPGDFDLGDPDTGHEIAIGPEGDCISLVAMQGELKLQGLLGRLVQPFLSI
jgi:putative transcriptional regulator